MIAKRQSHASSKASRLRDRAAGHRRHSVDITKSLRLRAECHLCRGMALSVIEGTADNVPADRGIEICSLEKSGKSGLRPENATTRLWLLRDRLAKKRSSDVEIKALAREYLARLERDVRERLVMAILAQLPDDLSPSESLVASKNLFGLREAIRERRPRTARRMGRPFSLMLDRLLRVGERSFYVRGEIANHGAPVGAVTAVSPEGWRIELAGSRPEGAETSRFCSFFRVPSASPLSLGWVFELSDNEGTVVETSGPPVIEDRTQAQASLLADMEKLAGGRDLASHIGPAMAELLNARREAAVPASAVSIGPHTGDADISLIVTVDERISWYEQQLIQIASDPELTTLEIIYVVQSPACAAELLDRAHQLHDLYGLSMKFVVPREPMTVAQGMNQAAQLARGRLLVLSRNSVLPANPGWIGRMARFHDSTPGAGAVGAKMLYPAGDSVSSAGMRMIRCANDGICRAQPRMRGLHRRFAAANATETIAATAEGCLLVSAQSLRSVGGLHDAYLRREAAHIDLCLRLGSAGRENWYLPDVEALDFDDAIAAPAELRFDEWLLNQQWRERMAALASSAAN